MSKEKIEMNDLEKRFEFRDIRQEEKDQAAAIEQASTTLNFAIVAFLLTP